MSTLGSLPLKFRKTRIHQPINFSRLRAFIAVPWGVLVFGQALASHSMRGALIGVLLLCGGLLGLFAYLRVGGLRRFPIATAMVLGYTSYYFLLPPLATAAEGRLVTNNLESPVLVLIHALICQLALLIAYVVYTKSDVLPKLRWALVLKVFVPSRYFAIPGNVRLFLMGFVGLAAMSEQIFVAGIGHADAQGVGNKLMQALFPLAYLPFCCLVRPLFGDNRIATKSVFIPLGVYTVILLLISIAHNTRSAFLIGISSIALAGAYGVLVGTFKSNVLRPRNVLVGLVVLYIVSGPVADLATSMVIVRSQRAELSPVELMRRTVDTFFDKEAIRSRRLEDSGGNQYWDEWYVDNVFFARLSNLKFSDNSIVLAEKLGPSGQSFMRQIEYQRVLSILPRPLLSVITPGFDKNFVGGASGGDFLLYAATGNERVLGGFRVGSLFGSGYAMFGWFYPLVLLFLVIPLFVIGDAQTRRISGSTNRDWTPTLSPMGAIGFFAWFFYLTSAATGAEALSTLPEGFLREWIQTWLIYVLIYWLVSLIGKPRLQK